MKLKPLRIHFSVTNRAPRKVHVKTTYMLESPRADLRPLLRAMDHYAKLIAKEISEGLWEK